MFPVPSFLGKPQEFLENSSFSISISNLNRIEKRFEETYLLSIEYEEALKNQTLYYKIDVQTDYSTIKIERM